MHKDSRIHITVDRAALAAEGLGRVREPSRDPRRRSRDPTDVAQEVPDTSQKRLLAMCCLTE